MKYTYAAIFETAGDHGYAVSFPDLPGCYSQGRTLSEALIMAQSALTQWIEYLSDKNIEIPKPSSIDDIAVNNSELVNIIHADIVGKQAISG